MYNNQRIRKYVAGIMLLLFAISVAPKQLLHDVIAGHKHNYSKVDDALNFQASKNNFQCTWHNDAVVSPFTDQPGIMLTDPLPVYPSYTNSYISCYYSAERFFSTLRGPPSLV